MDLRPFREEGHCSGMVVVRSLLPLRRGAAEAARRILSMVLQSLRRSTTMLISPVSRTRQHFNRATHHLRILLGHRILPALVGPRLAFRVLYRRTPCAPLRRSLEAVRGQEIDSSPSHSEDDSFRSCVPCALTQSHASSRRRSYTAESSEMRASVSRRNALCIHPAFKRRQLTSRSNAFPC